MTTRKDDSQRGEDDRHGSRIDYKQDANGHELSNLRRSTDGPGEVDNSVVVVVEDEAEEDGIPLTPSAAAKVSATAAPASAPVYGTHPAVYVIVWILTSGGVIVFNKYIFSTAGFEYPVFLTSAHLVFATITTRIMHHTGYLKMLDSTSTDIPFTTWYRTVLPIGFLFSASLVFSNSAYLKLSVAFMQMLKALMPGAVLLCGYLAGVDNPSLYTVGTVSVIVFGTVVASYGEVRFDLIGFLFQFFGIFFEAFRLVMIQILLKSYKMGPLVSLFHFAPVCAIINVSLIFLYEGTESFTDLKKLGLFVLLANCALAFALNIAVVLLIGKTSSLVLTLAGIIKDILLIMVSIVMFQSPLTLTQCFGYSVAIAGLFVYKNGVTHTKELLQRFRQPPEGRYTSVSTA